MSTHTDGKTGNTLAYAARDKSGHLSFFKFDRQDVGSNHVEFKIEFCGICHSDLHQIRGEWGGEFWPMVPGDFFHAFLCSNASRCLPFASCCLLLLACLRQACILMDRLVVCVRRQVTSWCGPTENFLQQRYRRSVSPTFHNQRPPFLHYQHQ